MVTITTKKLLESDFLTRIIETFPILRPLFFNRLATITCVNLLKTNFKVGGRVFKIKNFHSRCDVHGNQKASDYNYQIKTQAGRNRGKKAEAEVNKRKRKSILARKKFGY